MLAKNTRTSVAMVAITLIMGAMMALLLTLMPSPAQAQSGDVLRLLSIKCINQQESGSDEAVIKVNGNTVWGTGSGNMNSGSFVTLHDKTSPVTLSGDSALVQLWEWDNPNFFDPHDLLGEFSAAYTDGTQKTQDINYHNGEAVYQITYRVDRPDTVSPETVIDSGPSGPTSDNTPTFTFSGSDNVTPPSGLLFSYKVDNGEWSPFQAATSATTPALSDGPHDFFVKSKDAAGNEDASPALRSFAVDTVGPDPVHPWVTSTVPAATAKGVAPGANVTATFSEAMNASTINGSTVKLFKAGTTNQILADVTYNATAKQAILDPYNNLRRGTKYKAAVTTGARDLAGNQLDQDQDPSNGLQQKGWSFTIKN